MGGSPCQGFSFAGKQLNFEDPKSKLFFNFVEALNILKPKYFLLENVKMKKEYQDAISEYLRVEPININSSLVSAQNRERLYWTNIQGIEQPEDKGIFVHDILEEDIDEKYYMNDSWNKWWEENKEFQLKKKYSTLDPDKAITMTARQYASWNGNFISRQKDDVVIVGQFQPYPRNYKELGLKRKERLEMRSDNKSNTVATNSMKNILRTKNRIRKLTPIESERLQTLSDNYTEGISDSQRYKALGNGWTVDVIAHIFSYIPETHLNNVVSLFDGISCGQVALERAGKTYDKYYASEVDKYAIKITQKNYPNTIQLGDVTKIDWHKFKTERVII